MENNIWQGENKHNIILCYSKSGKLQSKGTNQEKQ